MSKAQVYTIATFRRRIHHFRQNVTKAIGQFKSRFTPEEWNFLKPGKAADILSCSLDKLDAVSFLHSEAVPFFEPALPPPFEFPVSREAEVLFDSPIVDTSVERVQRTRKDVSELPLLECSEINSQAETPVTDEDVQELTGVLEELDLGVKEVKRLPSGAVRITVDDLLGDVRTAEREPVYVR